MIFAPIQLDLSSLHLDDPVSKLDTSLQLLYTTRVGTMPLARDFGLSMDFLDRPMEVAKSLFAAEIVAQTAKFIPEVRVQAVTFTTGQDGQLIPKVVIRSVQHSGS